MTFGPASCTCGTLFDLLNKQRRVEAINAAMAGSGFWNNQDKAQAMVTELRQLTAITKPLNVLIAAADDMPPASAGGRGTLSLVPSAIASGR